MEETIESKEIKKVYIMSADFFSAPNFIERFKQQLAIFRNRIRKEEKEVIKEELNIFFSACMHNQSDEKLKIEMHLEYAETLNFYAQQYQSKQTYLNIINSFEIPQFKQQAFSRFPVKLNLTYAGTLVMYYNTIKFDEPLFSFDKTELLIKAKFLLWKTYIQHIEKKNTLSNVDLSQCLFLLSISLTELSRWTEPLYYLNESKKYLRHYPNIEYSRALLLEAIKDKSCLIFNSLLFLQIIDSCVEASNLPHILTEQKTQLKKMELYCRKLLKEQKHTIKFLRKHKANATKSFNKYNSYKKFCLENQLFLNEHSFYCNCVQSTRDTLIIETNHPHTKMEWVKQFNSLLDIFIYDFITARHNYYHSLDSISIPSFRIKGIKRGNESEGIKNALLKNSFKTLYSILDQIAHGIFQVLEIDYESKLKAEFPEEKTRPKIYFLNMWDSTLKLFEEKHFADNFYLISLYSISRDLNRSDYAALEGFRKLRNAMEHKILRIVNTKEELKQLTKGEEGCTMQELLEKTKVLMMLTKSAIYSFTYLVRRQSKNKETIQLNSIDKN